LVVKDQSDFIRVRDISELNILCKRINFCK
jgi:hypothetical protein